MMHVRKRNGDSEPVDVNKIVRAVERWAGDLDDVDPLRVATKTISGLYDGATTAELDRLSIQTAAEMIGEEPEYSKLAARLLAGYIDKEVRGQGIASFSQAITRVTTPSLTATKPQHSFGASRIACSVMSSSCSAVISMPLTLVVAPEEWIVRATGLRREAASAHARPPTIRRWAAAH